MLSFATNEKLEVQVSYPACSNHNQRLGLVLQIYGIFHHRCFLDTKRKWRNWSYLFHVQMKLNDQHEGTHSIISSSPFTYSSENFFYRFFLVTEEVRTRIQVLTVAEFQKAIRNVINYISDHINFGWIISFQRDSKGCASIIKCTYVNVASQRCHRDKK